MSLRKIRQLKNTLLFRLTVLYAGILLLSSSLVFIIFYFKIHTVTMEGMDEELLGEIEQYSAVLSEEGIEGVKNRILGESESEDPAEEFYRLLSPDGEVLAATDMSPWASVRADASLEKLSREDAGHVFQTLTLPERDYRARMITAVLGPGTVLQIGETLEDAEEYLEIFHELFFMLLILFIFISVPVGWFMAKRALLDIHEVTQTAREISRGVYDRRVQVNGRFEEIRRLGSTFNSMLDRIQNLLTSMREVNDNIAHDLRSPLTRIRGAAEMSVMSERSIDEYRNFAASTVEECDTLIDMINTMLDITEIESGVSEPHLETFDLVRLILEAVELFLPVAGEKEIHMKVDLPEKLPFHGDRKNLQRIVSNLLDNALKYTPEGKTITITVSAAEDKIEIVFEDTGIGIAETDLPHIFDRFYRCDTSRSLEGAGLGLSLAKALTEAMNGTISVASSINQGSRFAVIFPQ